MHLRDTCNYVIQPHLRCIALRGTNVPMMYLHLRGIAVSTRYSCTYTRNFCTYEIQLHLRGTAAPTRYSCFYEVQMHPRGTAAPTRYSCTHEVPLYALGTTVPYVRGVRYTRESLPLHPPIRRIFSFNINK